MIKSHFSRKKCNVPAISEAFVAEWDAGDALGYYGAILSFIGTVVLGALVLYQNRIIKTEADKKAALTEEQEHAENMPRFFMRFGGASGFCGSLKFVIMNVSSNIAYSVNVYDIKIKDGSKTIWESNDTYGAPVINPQKDISIQTKSPATNDTGEFTLLASMSCMDKYNYKGRKVISGRVYEDGSEALARLKDYGCLHFKIDVILGVSVPRYSAAELERIHKETTELIEYDGKEKTLFEWKQTQRRFERAVRNEQQKADMFEAAGMKRKAGDCKDRIKAYRSTYDDMCKNVKGLEPRLNRMKSYKSVDISGKSGIIKDQSRKNITVITIIKH